MHPRWGLKTNNLSIRNYCCTQGVMSCQDVSLLSFSAHICQLLSIRISMAKFVIVSFP